MPLLLHVIQYRIRIRPGYFINRVRPAWPGQNMTQVNLPSFNPGMVQQGMYHDKPYFLNISGVKKLIFMTNYTFL